MLSKVVTGDKTEKLVLESYSPPSPEEIDFIIEERKMEARRRKIVDTTPDDPLKAAKKEADRLLQDAETKLKEARVEALALKDRQEQQLRMELEKQYADRLATE